MQYIKALASLYSFKLAVTLPVALRTLGDSPRALLGWFTATKTYRFSGKLRQSDKWIVVLLVSVMCLQILTGLLLITNWTRFGAAGEWAFGLALLISYPIGALFVVIVVACLPQMMWYVVHPKKFGKVIVALILERQVKALRRKHHFKVIAVAGSVGKTSTKFAIAQLLGQNLRVRFQEGNYNDRVTIPLVFFDQLEPSTLNLFAWFKIFGENAAAVHQPYPYDVVVVEIGTDGPGQMQHFAYLEPDITVLTSIAPEHMEYFKSIDAVAVEELAVFDYSKKVLVNGDDTPGKYLIGKTFAEYSLRTNIAHNYYAKPQNSDLDGQDLCFETPFGALTGHVRFIGHQGAACSLAAVAVADMLGIDREDIRAGLSALKPYAGRMLVLDGVKQSRIIDDTYNASPVAVKAALDVLYASKAKQRIALLGSMNELGEYARAAHEEIGSYCDPHRLDMVITFGRNAERWIAPAARAQGCVVRSFMSHKACASFIHKNLKKEAVILAKGSQNGVFAEEVVKQLLAHPADRDKLVRQGKGWLKIKAKQFSD